MMLQELIQDVPINEVIGGTLSESLDTEIRGLSYDSRAVAKGDLFAALPGVKEKGTRYIDEAIRKGAAAVLVPERCPENLSVPQIVSNGIRESLARMASRFYDYPSRKMRLIGVTGTNGKTTVTYLVESILNTDGRSAAVLGTVNYRFAKKVFPSTHTTPESIDLQKILSEMREAGVTDVVMEVSSHALSMDRVAGVEFDAAAFTNLTQDHLDFHKDLQDYFEAKLKFFTDVLPQSTKKEKIAVLNMEDPRADDIRYLCPLPSIKVGLTGPYDVTCQSFELSAEGIRARVKCSGEAGDDVLDIHSPLIGRFNLENILVALAVGRGLGVPKAALLKGIEELAFVPGRLERILNDRGISAFVDYAHTPDALARVGETLRPLAKGRIVTVFGCGGDRDRGKRPLMGKEAAAFSDFLVITSDNPRTEDPERIIDDIFEGMAESPLPRERIHRVSDRLEALQKAVGLCRRGDILLIAGKGHEDYQIIGQKKYHFSDQESLRRIFGI